MKSFRRTGLALVIAFTAISTVALAATGSSIHGTITDPLGAVVPGAQVQLLRAGKPVAATTTNAEGKYQFAPLPAGRYQVKTQAPSFTSQQSDAIYLGSGSNATQDLTLKIGSVSQPIVVSATGARVPETQTGASISVITADQFQYQLPALEPLRQVPGVQVLENGQRGI